MCSLMMSSGRTSRAVRMETQTELHFFEQEACKELKLPLVLTAPSQKDRSSHRQRLVLIPFHPNARISDSIRRLENNEYVYEDSPESKMRLIRVATYLISCGMRNAPMKRIYSLPSCIRLTNPSKRASTRLLSTSPVRSWKTRVLRLFFWMMPALRSPCADGANVRKKQNNTLMP